MQEGRPWTFDKKLFHIKEYDASLIPNQVELCYEPKWVQMHNILFGMMNKFYGKNLEKEIGDLIEVDIDKVGASWGHIFWIKIWVNITKPLVRGSLIKFSGSLL